MTPPPTLTDTATLLLRRNRARLRPGHRAAMFLHQAAITDIQERLIEVNRTFTDPVIVTGFPEIWQDVLPNARLVPDDDTLALERGGHDLVIHAMGLHWANDLVGQLLQCRHALRPDGLFLGQFLGGRTLHELRSSLAEAETAMTGGLSPRVLPMAEIRDLGDQLLRTGFALPVADSFVQKATYATPLDLLADLRAMGETNALAGRLRHPTRRSVFARAAELYSRSFGDAEGRIPATFEMICLTGWSPDASQPKPLRPGSAKQRLADALNVRELPLTKDS